MRLIQSYKVQLQSDWTSVLAPSKNSVLREKSGDESGGRSPQVIQEFHLEQRENFSLFRGPGRQKEFARHHLRLQLSQIPIG